MSKFDQRYREGVHAYIMSLTPERKKDFEYQLYQRVHTHRRQLRDLKEELMEEVAALAFLQAEMYIIPFKKKEDGTLVALTEEKESETVEEKRRRA